MTLKDSLCFALLIVSSSCQTYPELKLPAAEECWNSLEQTGKLLCRDERLPRNERVYTRFLGQSQVGARIEDVCTNSDDMKVLKNELIESKKKLLSICRKYPKETACR